MEKSSNCTSVNTPGCIKSNTFWFYKKTWSNHVPVGSAGHGYSSIFKLPLRNKNKKKHTYFWFGFGHWYWAGFWLETTAVGSSWIGD